MQFINQNPPGSAVFKHENPGKTLEIPKNSPLKPAFPPECPVLQGLQISERQSDNKLLINLNIFVTDNTDFSLPLP